MEVSERGKGKGKGKGKKEREKRKVSGLCETFRVGWSMMVGLDFFFWKKKAEDGGLKYRWRLCFFLFFLADESMQSEVLLSFYRGTGSWE